MGRRSSPSRASSRSFGRGRSPSPTRAAAPQPQPRAVAPQPAPTQVGQPTMAQGPGLMGNIASTAAGVAIGHTMGHALTGALGLRGDGGATEQQAAPLAGEQQPQSATQHPYGQNDCKFEMEQFLACAQSQSNDLSLCQGFSEVLKECKARSQPHY